VRELEAWRAEERLRRRLAQEKVETKDYEAAVHQFLVKQIQQNIDKSELEKAVQANHTQRTATRRYCTLSEEPSRRSQEFLSAATLVHKPWPQRTGGRQSNLIGQEESLLTHILRKQRELQEKSLRIENCRARLSCQPQDSMASSGEKWGRSGLLESRTNNLLSLSYITAMRPSKQSTESLLPWDVAG
jgi:hypothetical protein